MLIGETNEEWSKICLKKGKRALPRKCTKRIQAAYKPIMMYFIDLRLKKLVYSIKLKWD